MRILTCERSRFCLSQWSWPRLLRAYANSLTDQGAGFLSYKHKKATKDFFVVRSGQGDQCSVVQGEFSDKPTGAIGGAPYASKDYAEAALKKLSECKGGEA